MKKWQEIRAKYVADLEYELPYGLPEHTYSLATLTHFHPDKVHSQDPAFIDGCHTWQIQCGNIKRTTRCPACFNKIKPSIERADFFANLVGMQLVPNQKITKGAHTRLKLTCKTCKTTSEKTFNALQVKNGCRACSQSFIGALKILPDTELKYRCETKGYFFISKEIQRHKVYITFKCVSGIVHCQDLSVLTNIRNGCGCKVPSSRGEFIIQQALFWYTGKNFSKIRKSRLRNLFTQVTIPHEFDFYNQELKVACEVDGSHHRKIAFGSLSSFCKVQEADKVKNIFCVENGITLIRVDDRDLWAAITADKKLNGECFEQYILKLFETIPRRQDSLPKLSLNLSQDSSQYLYLGKCLDKAKEHSGELLSPEYLGSSTPLTWKCITHGVFYAAPWSVINRNSWCKRCADTKNAIKREAAKREARNLL